MEDGTLSGRGMSRRLFLGAGSALIVGASPVCQALAAKGETKRRWINLVNTRSGKNLKLTYFADGAYVRGALGEVNDFMRDPWDKSLTTIDPALLDMVHELQELLELKEPLHMLSAYRSPKSNRKLRRRSRKVARQSYHMFGRAIDLRMANRDLRTLATAARIVGRGGIGVYWRSRSRHVHLDTGPVRSWYG